MKKRIFLMLFMVLAMLAGDAVAEEFFPPQAAGKGVIGGRNGEPWRVGYFESIVVGASGSTDILLPTTLATNAVDVANSIWGVSNGLTLEGATADAYELTLSTADVTGDKTITFPDANGNPILSNGLPGITESITGVNSGFEFEGTTADTSETTLTVIDPTADNTITFGDDTGSVTYTPTGTTTVAGDALVIPVTHAFVAKTTAGDAEALTLANGENGQILTIDLDTDGGGDGTLTPTTKSGFTSIVFADAGDNASLMYVDDTVGWVILGTAGVAAPPVTVD